LEVKERKGGELTFDATEKRVQPVGGGAAGAQSSPRAVDLPELSGAHFDVAICGGGLAGLTLARQLARSHPHLSIAVIERATRPLPEATHKVGESSVELGSQYLERLGLRDYLVREHLFKFGLRFFPGGGTLPIEARTEIGPPQEPIVPSYQLDRGKLENDLRAMVVDDGVVLVEGARAGAIELRKGEQSHSLEISRDGERARIECRWLVDATGRASLLRKTLKSTRGTRHPANACWFRVEGRVDITNFAAQEARTWHEAEWAPHRWRSTNHLMGPGYWAWVIPLSSGKTSIGIVVHDSHFDFDHVRKLENALAFLRTNEPVLADQLKAHEILDFGCLKNYSYNVARSWSADRWALVGEAGAFGDPLYSPGTDFIAFSNSFTGEMIQRDLAGEPLVERARELSAIYRSLVGGCVDLYRESAEVYGHAEALLAKIYWDNFVYWSYPCQFFLQGLYRLTGPELLEFMPIGQRFADLTRNIQFLFREWARLAPREPEGGCRMMPGFPSVLIDAHLDLQKEMSTREALDLIRSRLVEAEEIAGEMVLRVIDEVGEENADRLVELAGIRDWKLRIRDERVAATETIGLARRRSLRPLARDVERTLGRPPRKVSEETIRRVLGSIIETQAEAGTTGTRE